MGSDYADRELEPADDPVVLRVQQDFTARSKAGIEKYRGKRLDRDDLTHEEWLEHARQEAMDFVLYLTRALMGMRGEI